MRIRRIDTRLFSVASHRRPGVHAAVGAEMKKMPGKNALEKAPHAS
jgi:hypothetical protein